MRFEDEQRHAINDAVIYCRVSSKAQTKRGDGLNSQETRCRQYTDYKKYDVAQVFKDDLTGKTADRPGVQQLLSFLEDEHPRSSCLTDPCRPSERMRQTSAIPVLG